MELYILNLTIAYTHTSDNKMPIPTYLQNALSSVFIINPCITILTRAQRACIPRRGLYLVLQMCSITITIYETFCPGHPALLPAPDGRIPKGLVLISWNTAVKFRSGTVLPICIALSEYLLVAIATAYRH